MDAETLQQNLAQFTGSAEFYRHFTRSFVYTEGVQYLAEQGGLHWLIDLIASWQPKALQDPALRELQVWELRVTGTRATAICLRDTDDEAFRQEIAYTDSPLDLIRLYVENGVLLLPSEH